MTARAQNDLITMSELAERWGLSVMTIHRLITDQGLPSLKFGPARNAARRIRLADAERWLAARQEGFDDSDS